MKKLVLEFVNGGEVEDVKKVMLSEKVSVESYCEEMCKSFIESFIMENSGDMSKEEIVEYINEWVGWEEFDDMYEVNFGEGLGVNIYEE